MSRCDWLSTTIGLAIGIALFHQDWAHLFISGPFFTDDYYDTYWLAYKLTLFVAPLALLVLPGRALAFWAALVFPSLLLRHVLFLAEIGPTNTWPPVLFMDVFMTLPVLLGCYILNRIRSVALKKLGNNNAGAI